MILAPHFGECLREFREILGNNCILGEKSMGSEELNLTQDTEINDRATGSVLKFDMRQGKLATEWRAKNYSDIYATWIFQEIDRGHGYSLVTKTCDIAFLKFDMGFGDPPPIQTPNTKTYYRWHDLA